MQENKDRYQQSQQGSGSSENRGMNRNSQEANNTNLSSADKNSIAEEIGSKPGQISSIKELGGLSGRDDSSGGSGDRMENENTGKETER